MGGTTGVPTNDPSAASASAASVSPMSVAPPTGAADTGITPGTPGNAGVDFSKLPAWAEGLDKDSVQSIFSSLNSGVTPANSSVSAGTTENLGFPSAQPTVASGSAISGAATTGFTHADYPTVAAPVEHVAGDAPAQAPIVDNKPAAPAEDPNARVAVYLPAGGFGFGTPSGTFGSTTQNTYQQRAGPNGSIQEISNPYGITIGGVDSMNDPWQVRGARELGWLDPASYQQNTTYQQSGLSPQTMSYKPGDIVPAGTNNVPAMSKALYDFNMRAYGNPYGAGYTQQYIGGPAQTPVGEYPGYGGGG
jgi:hypothetical protein